jgi:predicted DNA-binding protein with PD1-like motif
MVPCDVPNILCCEILKVPHGVDLSKAIKDYIRRKKSSIYIMSANGCVDQVTLHTKIGEIITFQEKFEIVSMSGSILMPPKPTDAGVSICLSGIKGQVVAGDVIPPLVASGLVLLTVCPLANTASENISLRIYNREEHEPVCPIADEHMAKDGDDLLDAEGSLNGMGNMKSSNINDPSSSTRGPMF